MYWTGGYHGDGFDGSIVICPDCYHTVNTCSNALHIIDIYVRISAPNCLLKGYIRYVNIQRTTRDIHSHGL